MEYKCPKATNKGRILKRPCLIMILVFIFFTGAAESSLAATASREKHPSFSAGVLEIAGNTSFSVDYQREHGSDREIVHLRLTPSLGYFVLSGIEVGLHTSYIFDNVHEPGQTDDRSQRFLFMLGPTYHFLYLSDYFVPYAGLGFGSYYQRINVEDNDRADLQFALGIEGGCRWMLTEQVAVNIGFQYTHGFGEKYIGNTDFLGIEIGISLFVPTWPAY